MPEMNDPMLWGSWKMLSWTTENTRTGEKSDGLGIDPRSFIHYLPNGRMMVLVLRKDRQAPCGIVPTAQEKVALYDSMVAYAGTYTFAADRVVHHIDMSWEPIVDRVGSDPLLPVRWCAPPDQLSSIEESSGRRRGRSQHHLREGRSLRSQSHCRQESAASPLCP